MTMLLGYNFGEVGYITADTRGTYTDGTNEDKFQKIEIIKPQGIIVAVAGSAYLGSQLCTAVTESKLKLQSNQIRTYIRSQLLDNLPEEVSEDFSRLNTILLVEEYVGEKVKITTFFINFKSSGTRQFEVLTQAIKKDELVKVGSIGLSSPMQVVKVPKTISKLLTSKSDIIGIESYLAVTDELINTAKDLGIESIGGKTMILKAYRDSNDNFIVQAIRGYRSVIHEPNQFQDVSSYTDLDLKTGNFYLRDMRSEGRIVSHLRKENGRYVFRYDSCPKSIGKKDFFYTRLIGLDVEKALELEMSIK